MSEPFDHQDGHENQGIDVASPSPSVGEDWTSLPLIPEEAPVVRTPVEIVAALAATPADLERLLTGVSPEAMRQPAHDGEAAVVELVVHLRDWDAVVGEWVCQMLEDQEPPTIEIPDDSLWAIEHDYPAQDPIATLADFRDQRSGLVDPLNDMPAEDWERVAAFAGGGEQTLQEILDGLCRRDAEHLGRIREALA